MVLSVHGMNPLQLEDKVLAAATAVNGGDQITFGVISPAVGHPCPDAACWRELLPAGQGIGEELRDRIRWIHTGSIGA